MNLFYISLLLTLLLDCYAIPLGPNFLLSNNDIYYASSEVTINDTIKAANDYIEKWRIANEVPGLVSGVSVKGNTLWTEAFGLTDIENNVKTQKDSVWRMASVSKSLTTAVVGKLLDQGLLDLDKSVHAYLSTDIFPIKQWNGKNVTITVKQLMSHMAGLRVSVTNEFEYLYECSNVTQTLKQFKDEPLLSEPGTAYNYSNYGIQTMGAIIESIYNQSFEKVVNRLFAEELGMTSTFAERLDLIIPHRVRYYWKNKQYANNTLSNAPLLDDLVSYECYWPSAGLVSTVPDLLRFGNIMIKSFNGQTGFLSQSTVKKLWTASTPEIAHVSGTSSHYGIGWIITNLSQPIQCSGCPTPAIKSVIWHSGDISGESTYLALFPEQEMVIAVLTNLGDVIDSIQIAITEIATAFMQI